MLKTVAREHLGQFIQERDKMEDSLTSEFALCPNSEARETYRNSFRYVSLKLSIAVKNFEIEVLKVVGGVE